MKIVCHRGFWQTKKDHNTLKACLEATKYDGIEIDLRTLNGEIVLSHDCIHSSKKYDTLKSIFKKIPNTFYALNIKEDGMGPQLAGLIEKCGIKNYMCFDLSTPEEVLYEKLDLRIYHRFGDRDHRKNSLSGHVVDIFNGRHVNQVFKELKTLNRAPLLFISPELHSRAHLKEWKILKKYIQKHKNEAYLCTDFPKEAADFFEFN